MCIAAGGNWNNSVNAGVWARNCNNSRTNSNNNYGFRSDSAPIRNDLCANSHNDTGAKGGAFLL